MRMKPKTVRKWGYELVKVHRPPLFIHKSSYASLTDSSTYWKVLLQFISPGKSIFQNKFIIQQSTDSPY